MKAVMYHYVRPTPEDLPHFRYLHLDDFRRQLDLFKERWGFVRREDFLASVDGSGPLPEGVVLTFDDGFADHHDHVLPELLERGLWGIFYVPTGVHTTRTLLDVHRIHILLGRHDARDLIADVRAIVTPDMLSHAHVHAFQARTYTDQPDNDDETTHFKRLLNYYISYAWRDRVLDTLMRRHIGDEAALAAGFYMGRAELRRLAEAGMLVGSHSVSHPVFSKLEPERQEREIVDSFAFLEEVVGALEPRTFCYPYGDFHSFTAETEALLDRHGCQFSFNVEARDISADDLAYRPQALPRYDCNAFPYGRARRGALPA